MKIGFTGTREGMTPEQQRTFVYLLADRPEHVQLHHGCCVGADEEAHWLAFELGVTLVGHPPIDTKLQMDRPDDGLAFDGLVESKPYLERNRDIVDATDRLIATPKDGHVRGGTWYTINYAKRQGKPVTIIWPDGTTEPY